jgi:CelD/BcsL family acetyltransferase involved in cellulose biosynthesis
VVNVAVTAEGRRTHAAGADDPQTGVFEAADAVDVLTPEWDRLARSPIQHSIWARAWTQTFGDAYRFHVLTAGAPDSPAAIAPLVTRLRGPARLEFLGSELYEPMDVLGSDEDALSVLADELARSKVPLLLRRVPTDSPFVAAVRRAYSRRGLAVVHRTAGAPYFRLGDEWADPERQFSSRRRSDLRRARRRAEALGEVVTEVVVPEAHAVGPLVDEAVRVEAAGWKGEAGTALESDSLRAAFYRRYCEAAARRGILRLCFLRIGGRAAAVQVAVESEKRFWLLKIGYDDSFARCSPGTLLMLETVRYAATRGLEQYELLGVPEPWTRMWTELEHGTVCLRAYPAALAGVGALARDGARLAGRGWRGRGRR